MMVRKRDLFNNVRLKSRQECSLIEDEEDLDYLESEEDPFAQDDSYFSPCEYCHLESSSWGCRNCVCHVVI